MVERADPAQRARDVLAEFESVYGYDGALPVPVDDIADSLARLRIVEIDFAALPDTPKDHKLSGMLVCKPVNTIFVNQAEARQSQGRRRFTIAHELGHWYLHMDVDSEQVEQFCRPSDLNTKAHIEGQANAFAAALLMPSTLLKEQAHTCRMNIPLLAKRFDVSVPAMRVRLVSEDLLPDWMR